jgi:hypothetical protein
MSWKELKGNKKRQGLSAEALETAGFAYAKSGNG